MAYPYDKLILTNQVFTADTNVTITDKLVPRNRVTYKYSYQARPQNVKFHKSGYGLNLQNIELDEQSGYKPKFSLTLLHLNQTKVIPATIMTPSEVTSANFSNVTPLNSSDPIYVYQNSGMNSMSLVFKLVADAFKEKEEGLYKMVRWLKLATVPRYEGQVVIPPAVKCTLGNPLVGSGMDILTISGKCSSVRVNYEGPFKHNRYTQAQIDMSIDRAITSPRGA